MTNKLLVNNIGLDERICAPEHNQCTRYIQRIWGYIWKFHFRRRRWCINVVVICVVILSLVFAVVQVNQIDMPIRQRLAHTHTHIHVYAHVHAACKLLLLSLLVYLCVLNATITHTLCENNAAIDKIYFECDIYNNISLLCHRTYTRLYKFVFLFAWFDFIFKPH